MAILVRPLGEASVGSAKHELEKVFAAAIAQSLHDSLHQLGYRGWFDVDDLAEISRERIESAIEKCACMIVLLNDETHRSEWCQLEWLAAAEPK